MGSGPRNRTATEYNILEFCAIDKNNPKLLTENTCRTHLGAQMSHEEMGRMLDASHLSS